MNGKTVAEGEAAPKFSLPEAMGATISLEEEINKGPVILAFYPTDWGIICTLEMREFKKMLHDLQAVGARLLGISVNSVSSHRSWKEQLGIGFPLLSDESGTTCRDYGIMRGPSEFLAGRCERAVFVIDKNGIVRYAWVAKDPSTQPDYGKVLEMARSLR